MKRILVLGLSSNVGGVETAFKTFYNFFDKKKYNFDFVARENRMAFQEEYEKNNSRVFVVPNFIKHPIRYYFALKKIISEGQYDIMHINMLSAANILPILAAKKNGVRNIILHSHNGGTTGMLRKLLHYINRPFIKRIKVKRIACSKKAGDFLYGRNSSYMIVRNVVNYDNFVFDLDNRKEIRDKYKISDDCCLLGAVGQLVPLKNHVFLIEILKKIDNKNIRLMLVGTGPMEHEILKAAKDLGVLNKIVLTGKVDDVAKYYSAFDLFVMPSKYEGLCMAGLEAQMNGLPCFFSSGVSYENDFDKNLHMDLCVDTWADAISKFVDEKNARIGLSKKKLSLAKKCITDSAKLLIEQYNDTTGGK